MKTKSLTQKPSPDDILALLRLKNEAFAVLLDDSLLDLMMLNSSVEEYSPNEILMKQHDISDSLFLILGGRCTVIVNDKVLQHLEAGDIVGEMGVIQNTPRSATIKALEPTRALRVPGDAFKTMLQDPRLSAWVINLLTNRLKRSSHDAARVLKEMDELLLDQMELARIQRSLLPKDLPVDKRFRVHVLYAPCAYAGGDYYDAFMLDEDHLFLIIADVTGHGAQASISMAIVRSFIHQGNVGKTPGTALKRLNRYLFENGPSHHFVTAQAAIVDLKEMKLHYSYAGHPPILHQRGGECAPLKGQRAFFLRFRPNVEFKTSTLSLKPRDRFCFYTDGVVETFNQEGTMFNIEGLESFMVQNRDQPISSLPTQLETDLHKFTDGSPAEDDVTFMTVEIS